MLKKLLVDIRRQGTLAMSIGLILLGGIVHLFNANWGWPFAMSSVFFALGLLIQAVLVSLGIKLIDIEENSKSDFLKLTNIAFVVLLAGKLLDPIINMVLIALGL